MIPSTHQLNTIGKVAPVQIKNPASECPHDSRLSALLLPRKIRLRGSMPPHDGELKYAPRPGVDQ
jgi:hypothetical protein